MKNLAEVNGYTPNLDETKRAKRPIIEFDSGIELFNHGKIAKKSVTLFDTTTLDAFSTVSNSAGYIVDGVALADGMRVVFAKDTDPIVKNKIYKKDKTIIEIIYSFIELYFRNNISSKNINLLKSYHYFLEKINNTKTYNLDDETLFMEFEDKILNGIKIII